MAECALLGLVLMRITGLDLLSAYLATTPGGIDAVKIAALETGANIAVILPIQVLRVLVIMLAGPFLVRWLRRKSRRVEERPKPGQKINVCSKQSHR
jgi:uncharacterized membrane protein AbrB (regulator of aidB expression)